LNTPAPTNLHFASNSRSALGERQTAQGAATATESLEEAMRTAARESRTEVPPIAAQPERPAPQPEAATPTPASRLRAEIAALDRANAAARQQQYAQALDHLQHYRTEFPAGELARDADVLAIEALHAKGDHVAAQAAANAFLSKYATDPHAERVRKAH
jgi:TolA-binding protein